MLSVAAAEIMLMINVSQFSKAGAMEHMGVRGEDLRILSPHSHMFNTSCVKATFNGPGFNDHSISDHTLTR